ncbi:MAG: DUF4435 domain-containing protein [Bacteroidales bacterium]|jgi:hypothetical protein|nr:DUF4435 domain-containing protein [Bacteroidales bacterium]
MGSRSLKDNIDATDKINDVRLSLNSHTGGEIVWILVEGGDDCKIYSKFFDETCARVEFVNGGKGQLAIALNTLTIETEQVIGIQDADFLHLEKSCLNVKNLFLTDYHDIEMTMLSFEKVRNNFFAEYRMLDNSQAIYDNVLIESSFIAYIRWYNEKNHCGIHFRGVKFGENLSEITNCKIFVRRQELVNKLNNRSANKKQTLTLKNINDFIDKNPTNDYLNLCNGHDTTALFALIAGKQVSHIEFCRHLRLSFTLQEFSTTKLYAEINSWQHKTGFAILKKVA